MVTPDQFILLAISGGMDSMVMLDLFSQLRERLNLQLSIVHINHQLRGEESTKDEEFVQEMSIKYGIPCYCERVDVISYAHEHGLSKQQAARQLRYECFERIRRQLNAQAVATAHHADDNAETVLLNILRGTGIHGLAGIPIKRETGCIIRPLLFVTRSDIEAYAIKQNIKFRNDSSNQSIIYHRNLLRHAIIPVLQVHNPNIIHILNRIATLMRDVDDRLRRLVNDALASLYYQDSQERWVLNIKKLETIQKFLWSEIFVELLNRLNIEPTEKKVNALLHLCTLPTGRTVELASTVLAQRNRDMIVFNRRHSLKPSIQSVELGNNYDYNGYRVTISKPEPVPVTFAGTSDVEYIDASRLGEQLVLRSWETGDWFIPLGMKAKKKLSDFFIDQKIPRYQKTSIPILESDGDIVWICGKRLDDRFKISEHTKTAIRLTYQQST
jgi:tRNA(Ile)-lysidine synthase